MPRPPKKPSKKDLQEIEALAGLGLTQQHIADVKGINVDTLRKYAFPEWKRGKSRGIAKLLETAYKKALGGNVTLLIFLLKVGGYCEKQPIPEEVLKMLSVMGEEHNENET